MKEKKLLSNEIFVILSPSHFKDFLPDGNI